MSSILVKTTSFSTNDDLYESPKLIAEFLRDKTVLFKNNSILSEKIAEVIEVIYLKNRERLFFEGKVSQEFYIVRKGTLHVLNSQKLYTFTAGEHLGEMSLFTGKRRSASVEAVNEETIVYKIKKSDFDTILKNNSTILQIFVNAMIKRLKKANERIESNSAISLKDENTSWISPKDEKISLPNTSVIVNLENYSSVIENSLLKGINLTLLKTLSSIVEVPANSVIIKQGDEGDAIFFILEGQVLIYKFKCDTPLKLATPGKGKAVGAWSVTSVHNNCAYARTLLSESATLLRIKKVDFLSLMTPERWQQCLVEFSEDLDRLNKVQKFTIISAPPKVNSTVNDLSSNSPSSPRKQKIIQFKNSALNLFKLGKESKLKKEAVTKTNWEIFKPYFEISTDEIIRSWFNENEKRIVPSKLSINSKIIHDGATICLKNSSKHDCFIHLFQEFNLAGLSLFKNEKKNKKLVEAFLNSSIEKLEISKDAKDLPICIDILKLCTSRNLESVKSKIKHKYYKLFETPFQTRLEKEFPYDISIKKDSYSLTTTITLTINKLRKPPQENIQKKPLKLGEKTNSSPQLDSLFLIEVAIVSFRYTIKFCKEAFFEKLEMLQEPEISLDATEFEKREIETIFGLAHKELERCLSKDTGESHLKLDSDDAPLKRSLISLSFGSFSKKRPAIITRRQPASVNSLLFIAKVPDNPLPTLKELAIPLKMHIRQTEDKSILYYSMTKTYNSKEVTLLPDSIKLRGMGGSGKVFEIMWTDNKKKAILKIARRDSPVAPYIESTRDMLHEYLTLKRLDLVLPEEIKRNVQKVPYGLIEIEIEQPNEQNPKQFCKNNEMGILQQELSGGNLEEFSLKYPLTLKHKITIALLMARVLLALHEKAKLYHGDFKGLNIVMKPDNQGEIFGHTPVLIDFGTARFLTEDERPLEPLFTNANCFLNEIDAFNQDKKENESAAHATACKMDIGQFGFWLYNFITSKVVQDKKTKSAKVAGCHPYPYERMKFSDENTIRENEFILKPLVEINCPQDIIDLIRGACHPDPAKRMPLQTVIEIIDKILKDMK